MRRPHGEPISVVGGMKEMKRDRFDLETQLANRCKVQPLHYLRHRADNGKMNHPQTVWSMKHAATGKPYALLTMLTLL